MNIRQLIDLVTTADAGVLTEARRPRPRGGMFHGTSEWVLDQIRSGTNIIRPVYTDSNVSLGGAYLTARWDIAQIASTYAAHEHGSRPVILAVRVKYPLLPDEDWVVGLAERPSERDFDWATETYRDPRYQEFFTDLFSEYMGDGHSLSDEYVRRYEELNDMHGITWKDSMRHKGSVRQEHPLDADQIIDVFPAESGW